MSACPSCRGTGQVSDRTVKWRVLEAVRRRPGCAAKEYAANLVKKAAVTNNHLAALERAGFVRREGSMPAVWYPTESPVASVVTELLTQLEGVGVVVGPFARKPAKLVIERLLFDRVEAASGER